MLGEVNNIDVLVRVERVQDLLKLVLHVRLALGYLGKGADGLADVHAHVGNPVLLHDDEHGQEVTLDDVVVDDHGELLHREERRQPVQVVELVVQGDELGYYVRGGPLGTENYHQLLYIVHGCLADREDLVFQPSDADWIQLLIKEGLS